MHIANYAAHHFVNYHRVRVDQFFKFCPSHTQHLGFADRTQRCADIRCGASDEGDNPGQIAGLQHMYGRFCFAAFNANFNIAMRQNVQIVMLLVSRLDDDLAGFIILDFEQALDNLNFCITQFLGDR